MVEETKNEKLAKVLKALNQTANTGGAAVVTRDGLLIASDLSEGIDAEILAAMTAAMEGAAETALSELKQGNITQVIADAEKGKILTVSAGEKAILVVVASPKINLGLITLEMKRASEKISDILGA